MAMAAVKVKNPYETSEGFLNVELLLEEIKLFGFIVGARNIGKTYGFLLYSVNKSLESVKESYDFDSLEEFKKMPRSVRSEWQFFFLRRYGSQAREAGRGLILLDFYEKFIEEVDDEILEAYEVYIDYEGSAEGIRDILLVFSNKEDAKDCRTILIGYLSSVAAAEKIRKSGIAEVKLIIFDEFQAKKAWDYITDEPKELIDIFDSITRVRSDDCKLVALGNSGTILNPYFAYFDYDEFEDIKTDKRNGAAIFYHLPNKAKSRESGLFHDLIEGTSYGDYALNNKFGDLENFNVVKLVEAPRPRKCMYSVQFMDKTFGVWKDGQHRTIISKLTDPERPFVVDDSPIGTQRYDVQTYLILAGLLRNKRLFFDTPDLRLTAEKHLRKYIFKQEDSDWKQA